MIRKILQGTLVGIGSILPGVSGGMIAAAFNIYSKLIEALDKLTSHPIVAIKSIWQYLVGIALGILIGFIGIAYVFYLVPIPATLLFIGLILGGAPEIYFLAKPDEKPGRGILITTVTMVLMLCLTFLSPYFAQNDATNTHFILWIVVGILLALSLIVPGLSGTMLLLIIGYYGPLLLIGKELITAVVTLDGDLFFMHFWNFAWVLFGVVLAFILLGKLFNFILKKYPSVFYQVILGIIIASPINIMASLSDELMTETPPIHIFDFAEHWYMWLIGIILMPVGIYLARLFTKEQDETEKN